MASSVVEKYYTSLSKGRLLGHRCSKCGKVTFPPTSSCEHCGCFKHDELNLSAKGRVHFISHGMAPPPNPRFSELAPYAYGLVELETENIVVFGIITNAAVDAETMDKYYRECPMAVVADIIEVKGLPILAFRLI